MNQVNKTNNTYTARQETTKKLSLPANEIHLWVVRPQDFLNQSNDELLKRYKKLLTP